ncbi:lipid scramblase CLPTM1L [Episyrphus balteatus]|uniref:lipid scramblase CLPTM1L n=1 Tax=Episyrphus balteatus TaxID=286459 RepID=UPI0024851782|nr:lipid scramblase CLPTM1L [Episyrphus balteatus]
MYIPSLSKVLGCIFLIYVAHSMWTIGQLFTSLHCSSLPCYQSFLAKNPKMQLALFTSVTSNPIASETKKILNLKNFNYYAPFQKNIRVTIPQKTRRNGTLYMQVVFAFDGQPLEWKSLKRDGPTVIHSISLTEYLFPKVETYNLLGKHESPIINPSDQQATRTLSKQVTHLKSKVYITILTDLISLSHNDAPPELAHLIRVNRHGEILPIIKNDFFNTRIKNLVHIDKHTREFDILLEYTPIGIGKLRLMLLIEHATKTMHALGFSTKDVDEIKGIFSDTNVYLLCGTLLVGSMHLLFDFLSFKNDVIFWRRKKSYEGLSTWATLWRAFSQIIIFLYLMDENTSLLVLVPSGIGASIEMWKCKKILKLEINLKGIRKIRTNVNGTAEKKTEHFDREAMQYLSFFLYPLCLAGAIYSLMYQPHKSWYSWTLNSLVNGVYAFDFLFMLPQLFVNYKLKSVVALPWRSFMYKAFNTFIDDLFAFIINMPTAHRVACFRDDVIFLIYIYQRWLYSVDKTRLENGLEDNEPIFRTAEEAVIPTKQILYDKKNNC